VLVQNLSHRSTPALPVGTAEVKEGFVGVNEPLRIDSSYAMWRRATPGKMNMCEDTTLKKYK
jgi:hypothetical protein